MFDTPVVILAAGGATRMEPLSSFVTKPMVPIGSTPLIGCIIGEFFQAGFRNFIVVYGKAEDQIVPYIKQLETETKCHFDLVKQPKPMGMADAILLTRSMVYLSQYSADTPFFVTAGDVLFPAESLKAMMQIHDNSKARMTLALAQSLDPRMAKSYGNVACENGQVLRIVEKPGPDQRVGDYYSMPIYLFTMHIFDWLEKVEISKRGEKELQDAIQMEINAGDYIAGINLLPKPITPPEDGQYHVTYPRDFLSMNFLYLNDGSLQLGCTDNNGIIVDPVAGTPKLIDEGAVIGPNVFLGEGSSIGLDSRLKETYIFPHARIGENCILERCIVGESVNIPPNSQYTAKLILASGIFDLV
jgi:glucose-1-phosphate thymidylyltransferase